MATSAKPLVDRTPVTSTTPIELDFGDTDFLVRAFSDGMWAVEVDGYQLLVDTDQMQRIVGSMDRLGKERGWT